MTINRHYLTKNILRTIIFITLFLSSEFANSQDNKVTAYESKVMEIADKYLAIVHFGTTNITKQQKVEISRSVNRRYSPGVQHIKGLVEELVVLVYAQDHSEAQTNKFKNQIRTEFKNAEKLKTSVDFEREKEIQRKEKEKKARKAEYKKREEQLEYEKTDYGGIQRDIRNGFKNWNEKGEFEKETEYKKRLKEESLLSFNKVSKDKILSRIESTARKYKYKLELSQYNSENESFSIVLNSNDIILTGELPIPIDKAEDFKNNWDEYSFDFDKYEYFLIGDFLYPSKLKISEHNVDYNNTVKNEYFVEFTYKNKSDLEIDFNDLDISNEYLQGYVFKYSFLHEIEVMIDEKEEQIKHEKRKLDSIELSPYNIKLDSIVNRYNTELLKNPYNINEKIIVDYQKVTDLEKKEEDYKHKIKIVKQKFESINKSLEGNLRRDNPEKFIEIYYDLNSEKKLEADEVYIQCKCSYRSRVEFDLEFTRDNYYKRCNCRREKYLDVGQYYFPSEEEFNKFFDLGEEELEKEINRITFKREKDRAIKSVTYQSDKIKKLNFKGIKNNLKEGEVTSKIYKTVDSYKDKSYYDLVISELINLNKRMAKEWKKRKSLFSSKTEFYKAYISDDYKKIFKEKKNSQKN